MINGFFDNGAKTFEWRKTSLVINGTGTTDYLRSKEWSWTSTSSHIQKVTQNGWVKIVKLLGKTVGVNLHDLGVGSGFFDITPKKHKQRKKNIDILYFIKI